MNEATDVIKLETTPTTYTFSTDVEGLQHVRVRVIDTNPDPTYDISGLYTSVDFGREMLQAFKELINAAESKAAELDVLNGRED